MPTRRIRSQDPSTASQADVPPADGAEPRRTPSQAIDAVVSHVKQQIKLGALTAGHRLVEAEIVAATGASRAHVRDALKQLATEGFVQIEEFKGASIRRLSRAEVIEMYQLRELLEGFAIRLAAQSTWTAADKAELRALQAALDKAERALQQDHFRQLNDDYHNLIRRVANHQLALEVLERLRLPLLLAQFHRFFDSKALKSANADHRQMTTALLAGDAATAEKVMRRHVTDSLKFLMALEDHFFAP
ncbi:GntR family transcriptional regulator [Ideonella sp. DXS22W]|uniref:GntR family transcriptional regulator n=1 Tax=Pseudaquabacterium inlustre TaxID=2984192 RepID=A0ABU9CLL7_9BURK